MQSTIRCQSCGQDVPTARFCARCGHSLTDHSPSATLAAPSASVPAGATVPIPDPSGSSTFPPPDFLRASAGVGTDLGVSHDLPDAQVGAAVQGTRPRLSNRNVGIVATTIALLAVAGYLVFGTGGESHTVTGQMALTAGSDLSVGSSCEGTGGYSDIAPGAQVIIEDETGATLATSSFSTGTFDGVSCIFGFQFIDVPKAAFYRVHQSSDRGVLQFSYQEMVESNWSVYLTLGDSGQD